jgi:hypothetical protein
MYRASSSPTNSVVIQQRSVKLCRCSDKYRTKARTIERKIRTNQLVSESDECEDLNLVVMLRRFTSWAGVIDIGMT